jgi:hypothetical protein
MHHITCTGGAGRADLHHYGDEKVIVQFNMTAAKFNEENLCLSCGQAENYKQLTRHQKQTMLRG